MNTSEESEQIPERPIECGECKRPIAILYTEVSGKTVNRMCMCSECPVFRRKVQGGLGVGPPPAQETALSISGREASVCCGSCGLGRDEVAMGSKAGCPLCYAIFEEEIFDRLLVLEKVSKQIEEAAADIERMLCSHGIGEPIHKGRRPYTAQEEHDLSAKLVSLQKTLHETLSREDYEQAAWIRDQIQEITKAVEKGSHVPKKRLSKQSNGLV